MGQRPREAIRSHLSGDRDHQDAGEDFPVPHFLSNVLAMYRQVEVPLGSVDFDSLRTSALPIGDLLYAWKENVSSIFLFFVVSKNQERGS
jgi:hypothetical protein